MALGLSATTRKQARWIKSGLHSIESFAPYVGAQRRSCGGRGERRGPAARTRCTSWVAVPTRHATIDRRAPIRRARMPRKTREGSGSAAAKSAREGVRAVGRRSARKTRDCRTALSDEPGRAIRLLRIMAPCFLLHFRPSASSSRCCKIAPEAGTPVGLSLSP